MPVPNSFANVTTSIPLSQLDANFNTPITLGNTAIQLGNTVTTLNNMTLANVTISSGNVTITNVSVTTANVTTANITTAVITTANVATANVTTSQILNYGTANSVQYLNTSKALTSDANFVYTATGLGVGTSSPAYKLHVSNYMALGTQATAGAGAGINMIPSSTLTNWFVGSNYVTSGAFEIIPSTAGGGSTFTTPAFMLNSAGNAGLGVTPSAWNTGFKALQVSNFGLMVNPSNGNTYQLANAYFDSVGYKYLTSAAALRFEMVGGAYAWSIAPSGTAGNAITFTQAMTLNASGILLVGTTSASASLAAGGLQVTDRICVGTGSVGTPSLHASGDTNTGLYFPGADIVGFTTGGTERARIDTASLTLTAVRILISGASGIPAPVNNGDGNIGTATTNGLALIGKGSTNDIIFLNKDGNTAGRVATGATTITTSSDERLKENLVPIENAVDKVAQLRTVTGNYKSDPSRNVAFLIAQDVDAVFPQAVEKGDPEELGINYNWIIPLALAAIKELNAKVEALEAQLKGNA